MPRLSAPEKKRRHIFRRKKKAEDIGTEEAETAEPESAWKTRKRVTALRRAQKRFLKGEKKKKKKLLQSCELIEKKCRSRSYSSLAELYRDIQLTALPEKKATLKQRLKGVWIRNRDRIFRVLLVVCAIVLIVALIMLISQILFGDIPLLRLFRHCFDTIGTEQLNVK